MRSTGDVIAELEKELATEKFEAVLLVIAFDSAPPELIDGADNYKLQRLNALIERGGEPIGFVALGHEVAGQRAVNARCIAEHANQFTQDYLDGIVANFGQLAEQTAIGAVAPGEN